MTSDRINDIRDKLVESRDYLDYVLDHVGDDKWDEQVYSDGLRWTVRQIVIHMADADRGTGLQAMNIAEGKDIIPEDFDLERYNQRMTEKKADVSVEEARARLDENRRNLLEWLFTIDPAVLDNKGRHATLKIMTVEEILRLMALHERSHAADIARVLQIPPR